MSLRSDDSANSDGSEASSAKEEGELTEEEEEGVQTPHTRLFPQELFVKMLPKVLRALELMQKAKSKEGLDPDFPEGPFQNPV